MSVLISTLCLCCIQLISEMLRNELRDIVIIRIILYNISRNRYIIESIAYYRALSDWQLILQEETL